MDTKRFSFSKLWVYYVIVPKEVINHEIGYYFKGQLISECLFDILNFAKTNEKFVKFLP